MKKRLNGRPRLTKRDIETLKRARKILDRYSGAWVLWLQESADECHESSAIAAANIDEVLEENDG